MTKKTTPAPTRHIAETRMPEKNIYGLITCTLLGDRLKVEVKARGRNFTTFYENIKITFIQLFNDNIISIKRKFLLSHDNEKNKEILTDEINKVVQEIIYLSSSNNFKKRLK